MSEHIETTWNDIILKRMEERNHCAFMLGVQLVDTIVERTGDFDKVPFQFFAWYLVARVTELLQAEATPEPYEVAQRTAQDLRKLFEHADRIVGARLLTADPAKVELFMALKEEAMTDLMMRPAFSNEDLSYGGLIPAPMNVEPVGNSAAHQRGT